MERISGWGGYPTTEGQADTFRNEEELRHLLAATASVIPRGLGRSYGDSAVAPYCLSTLRADRFIAFDSGHGTLRAQAGVSLAEILRLTVPHGWFLPVTPGTAWVTLGGAVASDVHGKNHHVEGSFCDHITELRVMLADGRLLRCSPSEESELFHATCGGMGLTGVILEVTVRMRPLRSDRIDETIIKADNLEELLQLFSEHQRSTYSVAWIDCLAKGEALGRSLLLLGEHGRDGGLSRPSQGGRLSVPFHLPGWFLNRHTVRAFNALYYQRIRRKLVNRRVHYHPFFYPLDKVANWNRMYGRRGFLQYQVVLPRESGSEGLRTLLQRISDSELASFLAVLKLLGKGNDNYLSFPMEGYTLALDFRHTAATLKLFKELDAIVADHAGRLYLSKDACMERSLLEKGYPQLAAFGAVRARYGADQKFHSLQSRRLGF